MHSVGWASGTVQNSAHVLNYKLRVHEVILHPACAGLYTKKKPVHVLTECQTVFLCACVFVVSMWAVCAQEVILNLHEQVCVAV